MLSIHCRALPCSRAHTLFRLLVAGSSPGGRPLLGRELTKHLAGSVLEEVKPGGRPRFLRPVLRTTGLLVRATVLLVPGAVESCSCDSGEIRCDQVSDRG